MRYICTIWFSVLALLLTLASCEDHPIANTQRFRIKTTRTITLGSFPYDTSLVTGVYNYDGNGRLANYVDYSVNSSLPNDSTIMTYDAQGRILKTLLKGWNAYRKLWNPRLSYSYEYDMNGNISIVKEYVINVLPTSPSLVKKFQLEYDGTKLPIKVTTDFWDIGGFKLGQSVEQYIYSGGNVIKVEKSENQSAKVTTTFQYDDKFNPFYELITGEPNISIFSKNNVVTSDNQYSYDSNSLLSKIVTTTSTVEYKYEAY